MFAVLRTLTNDILNGLEVLGETAFPEPVTEVKISPTSDLKLEAKIDQRLIVIENGACVGCSAPGSTEAQACDYCGRGKDRE